MEDNKPLIIGVGVLLALFIAFPMLSKLKGAPGPPAPGSPAAVAAAAAAAGPDITSSELAGSVWKGYTSRGAMFVEFRSDGSFVATPDGVLASQMLQQLAGISEIVGSWTMTGKSIALSATVAGNAVNLTAQVQGRTISIDGNQAERVR